MMEIKYDKRIQKGKDMSRFSKNMKFKEIKKIREIKAASPYLIYGGGLPSIIMNQMKLGKLRWNLESLSYGINHLIKTASKGDYVFPVYSASECKDDKKKEDVNVIYFPSEKPAADKPFIIVCAGGAYMNVCSVLEAYPVVARMNELGYNAFALTYRVGGKELMPKPLDDLAAALKYIHNNSSKFKINADRYIVTGFSAGGNLTTLWGTDNHGYKAYGLPKPEAMFPIYPEISSQLSEDIPIMRMMFKIMLGKNCSKEKEQEYRVLSHMSQNYPPCYIVCCKDDSTVTCINSEKLKEKLDELGISARLEEGEKGDHGFGEGRGTDVEGWIGRAIEFYETLNKE